MKSIFMFIICGLFLLTHAQDVNKIVADSSSGKPILIGETTREAFRDTNFSGWYNTEYDSYEPDPSAIDILAQKLPGKNILIVMGTWCSDSRREVPRLLKILDNILFPKEQIRIISVDRTKAVEGMDLEIEFVPTIIIYDGETELGRIIEAPVQLLEEDIAELLLTEIEEGQAP